MTCTHCQSPSGRIHEYRIPDAPAAICQACVERKSRELSEWLGDVDDLSPSS